ncbi:MAG TPA: hypothetical protein VIW24_12175 [Aldersonia sp.]
MTTFVVLVLAAFALEGVFVLVSRRQTREGRWSRWYRHNHFRPAGSAGFTEPIDRDAQRIWADTLAMSRRGPHN